MKRVLFALIATLLTVGCNNDEHGEYYPDISTRELHYVSRSGERVEFSDDAFDAAIISNTYNGDKGVIRFASSLHRIGFLGSLDITSITIPTTVTTFEGNPFRNCKNLARFISKYSTSDGYALVYDSELIALARNYREDKYDIPYGVKGIGECALYGSSIKEVSIPNSVAHIGDKAFYDCKYLETLTLPERLETLGSEVCVDCVNLKSVALPRSVDISEDFAGFIGCHNLETFSGDLTSEDGRCLVINKRVYAFAPANLTEYTIPEGITAIADRSFAKCTISTITLPSTVVALGSGIFYNCSNLSEIYVAPTTPPTIKSGNGSIDPFENIREDYTIYVPTLSYSKYTSDAHWANYSDHIQTYVR